MGRNLLTQEEIDALLSGSEDLSELERDTISELGNISLGSAATVLSTLVGRKVRISVPNVTLTTLDAVRRGYPVPCLVFRVEYVSGLEGKNLLVMKESDAAVIATLMMGGDTANLPEELDELYLSAVTEAMNQMMGAAATAMSDMFGRPIDITPPDMRFHHLETNDDAIDGMQEGPVVQVSFRLEIEDTLTSEFLQLIDVAFAKDMVRDLTGGFEQGQTPVMDKPATQALPEEPQESAAKVPSRQGRERESPAESTGRGSLLGNLNIDLIKNIPVRVRAILGRTRLPIERVLSLGPGSIVELDALEGEPIEVLANDTLIARGEVVVVGETFGVRITEVATPYERISSVS